MGVISWTLLGIVTGLLANRAMRLPGGAVGAVGAGVAGAFLGGAVFSLVANRSAADIDAAGLAVALSGALVLVALVREADRAEPPRTEAGGSSRAAEL